MVENLLKEFIGKTVLITGASGFIGGRLTQVLSSVANIRIKAVVHNYSNAVKIARYPVEIIRHNIVDDKGISESVKDCDIVFHCAYGNYGDWRAQRQVNVEGTKNVLRACKDSNVKRLVYLSSMVVYGIYTEGNINESLPYKYSRNSYSDSKIDAEKIVVDYCKKKLLPISIIQPSVVYGPWAPTFTIYPLNLMKKGKIILPGDGEGICNPVYIDDLIQALLLAALKKSALNEKFLISGGKPTTWKEFYSYYSRLFNDDRIVNIEMPEILKLVAQENRTQKTSAQLLKLIRNDSTIDYLLQLPAISKPYLIIRNLMPKDKRKKIRNKITNLHVPGKTEKLIVPILEDLSIYKTRAAHGYVDMTKASELLEYCPKYDLTAGMALTTKWAAWAGLV